MDSNHFSHIFKGGPKVNKEFTCDAVDLVLTPESGKIT